MDFSIKYLSGVLLIVALAACQPLQQADIWIKNGTLLDGSGGAPFIADILIDGGIITFTGHCDSTRIRAAKIIDATGYTVTPGFIDVHTHAMADLNDSTRHANLNYLFQGVTTVMTGNDGGGVIQIGKQLADWERQGIGTNAAILVGHRTIRKQVMKMEKRPPTTIEMDAMKKLVAKGMEEGALGFSTGLYYAPASFATTEEVVELAKVAAGYGGIYDAHIRDESSYNIGLLAAVDESIQVARDANIAANISHIKCLGVDVWGLSNEVINHVVQARSQGLKVTADQYPYRASGTHLDQALLPGWVYAGNSDFESKFSDPVLKDSIDAGMEDNLRRRGGPGSLLLTSAPMPGVTGKTLAEISSEWQMPPIEAAKKIIVNGSAEVASFNMQEEDIQNFMQQDWVMTSSDGTVGHPRKFGTFPKKIREYVLEKGVLTLPEMVRKSTDLPATVFRIPKRGLLKMGYHADVLIFKPEAVKDKATYEQPDVYAEGMEYVIVNGRVVIDKRQFTGTLAGRAIRRGN